MNTNFGSCFRVKLTPTRPLARHLGRDPERDRGERIVIGTNTAIFSIAHALLLRALPVKDPAGLVYLRLGNFMSWGHIEADDSLTVAQWNQLLARQDVLAGTFAYADANFDVVLNGSTREINAAFVLVQREMESERSL
jgi:hypothetical protein